MKALKFLRNSAGISMIEVMMAVSVVGGLSLTVAQLMKNTSESTKQNEAKQENVSLKGLIQNNLSVPQACKNTFGALITQANLTAMTGTGTVAVPNIRNKVALGTIVYSSATNLKPLTITTMVLTNYVAAAGTADLVVNSHFQKSPNQFVMVKPIKIPINLNIDNTNPALPTLVSCSSMAISGGEWMLAGNAGTVDGTDYIGTSDNQPLNFRVNNQKSGRITSTGETYLGYRAGNSITSGTNNTIIGANAVFTGTTTIQNTTAIGTNALYSTTSTSNTAIGNASMYRDTTGQDNVAVGHQTLYNNTIGNGNVAVGIDSLYNNTGATHNNTAIGTVSLFSNTSGQGNTGLGQQSLYLNTTGSQNTAVGQYALRANTNQNSNTSVGSYSLYTNAAGNSNTAIGTQSGQYTSSGSYNTFVGTYSAPALTTGSNNIFIGYTAGTGVFSSTGKLYIESLGNATPLIGGDFSARTVSIDGKLFVGETYIIGNSSATLHITRSDIRLKKNIQTLDGSLDKVLRLRGVRYNWKEDKNKLGAQVGLIAQEVEKEFPEVVLGRDNNKKMREVNYSGLVAPLIESIKELYAKILALIKTDARHDQEIKTLKAENEKLKHQIKQQQDGFEVRMKKLEADVAKQ